MIGLDIKVKNIYSNYLYKIFNGINLTKYDWVIIADDILYPENGDVKEGLFGTDVLDGEEFSKCISRDNYYMIFVDLKAYPLGESRIEIKTYEDFSKSNCEVVFLCTDSTFIEFYCKDKTVLDRVYSNCISDDFEKAEYLSVEDVSKRSFVAW